MGLQSTHFRGDPKLEACAVSDPAHITPGAVGNHVSKIQTAIVMLDNANIVPNELTGKSYGTSTAAAVLAFKKNRKIINYSYQIQADNIVGKMTIAVLDKEMFEKENKTPDPNTCVLDQACPADVRGSMSVRPVFAGVMIVRAPGLAQEDDELKMQLARKESRRTLLLAIKALGELQQAIVRQKLPFGRPLSVEELRILNAAAKWLNVNASSPILALPTIASAVLLMQRNLAIKNSSGASPQLKRVPGGFHAQVINGDPDTGVECGDPFFTVDGPNCRRDVITHEFFHFLGVKHGGGTLNGPTIRGNIKTPSQALDSADNLAQVVGEIATLGGKTDACARTGE